MGSDKTKAYGAQRRDEFLHIYPEDLKIVGLDTPHKSRADHALWDERAQLPVSEKLVIAIMENGFIPEGMITIVKDGEDPVSGKPNVYVRDGRQRTKALREANKRRVEAGLERLEIPSRAVKLGQPTDQMIGMIGGNSGRTEDDPVVKGRKAQDLINAGKTPAQVAAVFCVSQTAVTNWLKLLDRHPDVLKAVQAKKLSLVAAVQMEGMSQEEQKAKLADLLKMSGKAAEGEIEKTKAGRGRQRATMGRVRSRKQVETLKTRIEEGGKQGHDAKIVRAVLDWFSGDDDALVEWPWLRDALAGKKARAAAASKKAAE